MTSEHAIGDGAIPSELDLEETRRWLADAAHRRFGKIPAELIAAHVLRVTDGADFAVRRAAFEALRRRMANATADRLRVASAPTHGIGTYRILAATTKRGSRAMRPYDTTVESISPIRGECSCADYLKGSLALCKHLLVALDAIFAKPRLLAAARRYSSNAERVAPARVRLQWDPVIPLRGEGDRLLGLRLEPSRALGANRDFDRDGQLNRDLLTDLDERARIVRRLGKLIASGRIESGVSVRPLIDEERAIVDRLQRGRDELERARKHLRSLKRVLYPYQREGVERFLARGRLLLADDMGLGKTTQAIAACHALFHAGVVRRGIIVTPASLKPQWLREWEGTTDVPAVVVSGSAEERAAIYRKTTRGFLIVNYEIVLRDFTALVPFARDLAVLDEAQRIKNYATKSSMVIKALPSERRLVLSGTPMENRLDELASVLDWVDDLVLAPKWRITAWHTMYDGADPTARVGARNLDVLRARLAKSVVRRHRADVIRQLPSRTDTRVPVAMTAEQLDEHESLRRPISALINAAQHRPLTQAQFLRLMLLLTQQRMIANGLAQTRFDEVWPAISSQRPTPAILEGLFTPKLYEARRLVDSLVCDQDRKIVIFSQWRRMLHLVAWAVSDLLADAGKTGLFFTGAESAKQRTRSLVDFHDDPRAGVLFLTDAGGVGLNLQHAATACINVELPWNPAVLEQRIGRIHRLGQKRPIDVFNLVAEPSIESRIAALVATKQAMFKSVFDGTTNEVKFEGGDGFLNNVREIVGGDIVDGAEANASEASGLEAVSDDLDSDGAVSSDSIESSESVPSQTDELTALASPAPSNSVRGNDEGGSQAFARVLASMRFERKPDGGMRIDAPPEAATALAAMFEFMGKMLRSGEGSHG